MCVVDICENTHIDGLGFDDNSVVVVRTRTTRLTRTLHPLSHCLSHLGSTFSEKHPRESRILLAVARVHDLLNDTEKATLFYKKVSEQQTF